MATEVWDAIEAAVSAGDAARVVDLCTALEEPQRRHFSKQAAALAKRTSAGLRLQEFQDGGRTVLRFDSEHSARSIAASSALFSVGPPPGARSTARVPDEDLERAVRSRPRPWRDKWALQVGREEWNPSGWQVLRRLIRQQECAKPDGLDYVRAMVRHAAWRGPRISRDNRDLRLALLEDPELLDSDVWRIFELEEKVLSEPWFEWGPTLIQLANEGIISRGRLLDESIGALRRDFAPGVASSFTAFHDRVDPTPEELTERQHQYLRLLSSPVESTVGFALRHLTIVERSGALDDRAFIEHLAPALAVRSKGHAKRAISLLDRVAKREPALHQETLELGLDALAHEAPEVQDAALRFLTRYRDQLTVAHHHRLQELQAHADPALRSRVAALAPASADAAQPISVAVVAVPTPLGAPATGSRLLASEAVQPISSVDELLDLAAVLLERSDNPDDLERFIDGVARLCDEPVPAGRSAAVVQRAESNFRGWAQPAWTASARLAIAVISFHWLNRTEPLGQFAIARGPAAALGRRLRGVAKHASAGRAGPLLSAPTHRGGWIDPIALVDRLGRSRAVDDDDLAQALLRLAPENQQDAKLRLDRLNGESAAVTRAALGTPEKPPRFRSQLPASWDAIDLIRRPDFLAVEPIPDVASQYGMTSKRSVPVAPPACPARLMVQHRSGYNADGDSDFRRWLAHVWPANREPYYAVAFQRYRSVTLWLTQTDQETIGVALEPLLHPDEPFGPHALELLAAALGSAQHDRLLAADIVAEAIKTRRLPITELGKAIARELRRDKSVPHRWAASLEHVPEVSALHAHETQQVIEATLAALGSERPQITKLLDLLRRVAQDADAQVTNPNARSWLEGATGRSKSSQIARAILQVTGNGGTRSVEAAAAALEGERDQALRRSTAPAITPEPGRSRPS